MSYIAQKHDWDCSPTALANALHWRFKENAPVFQISLDYYEEAIKALETDKTGTSCDKYEEVLFHVANITDFKVNKVDPEETEAIIRHLEQGNALLLGHKEIWLEESKFNWILMKWTKPQKADWHDSLWIWSRWGWFLGVNVKAGKKYFLCRKQYFVKLLTAEDNQGWPEVFLLTKST